MIGQESLYRDLTRLAAEGKLEPALGRARELFAIAEILTRRQQKNVLLVGHSGVGRTRLVEQFAIGVARGDFKNLLPSLSVLEIVPTALTAGSPEVEQRLDRLFKYLRTERDIIVFVNDLHAVLGPEEMEHGSTDHGHLLRSAMVNESIRCIARATPDQYATLVQQYPHLTSTFEALPVHPLTASATLEILQKLKPQLESYHGVDISIETLEACVALTEKLLPERYFPGKAIEVLDNACARYRLKEAARSQNAGIVNDRSWEFHKPYVSIHDLRRVIEGMTVSRRISQRTPVSREDLEEFLRSRTYGQSRAIVLVAAAIRAAQDPDGISRRPVIFDFAGPPGSGKRHLAKCLSRALDCPDNNFIEFDEGQIDEKQFIRALADTAPHCNESSTTAAPCIPWRVFFIRTSADARRANRKWSIPLLKHGIGPHDLMQEPNLTNAIFIFSFDLSPNPRWQRRDSQACSELLRAHLQSHFATSFGKTVPFFLLDEDALRTIARDREKKLNVTLSAFNVNIRLRSSAIEYLLRAGHSETNGAREIVTLFEEHVANPIVQMATSRKRTRKVVVHVKALANEIIFQRGGPSGTAKKDTPAAQATALGLQHLEGRD